jgi:hypothetical protein
VAAPSARGIGVKNRSLTVLAWDPRILARESQDLHIDVRLEPVIASDTRLAAATGFASLMNRDSLFFWLSIAWLAVLCAAFAWTFVQMTH